MSLYLTDSDMRDIRTAHEGMTKARILDLLRRLHMEFQAERNFRLRNEKFIIAVTEFVQEQTAELADED